MSDSLCSYGTKKLSICYRNKGKDPFTSHPWLCQDDMKVYMPLPIQIIPWIYGPIMTTANVTFTYTRETLISGFNVTFTLPVPGIYNILLMWQFVPRGVSTSLMRAVPGTPLTLQIAAADNNNNNNQNENNNNNINNKNNINNLSVGGAGSFPGFCHRDLPITHGFWQRCGNRGGVSADHHRNPSDDNNKNNNNNNNNSNNDNKYNNNDHEFACTHEGWLWRPHACQFKV